MNPRYPIIVCLAALASFSDLYAQGGSSASGPASNDGTEGAGPADPRPGLSREEVEDIVRREIERDRANRGWVLPARDLTLRIGGGFEFEYRQAQQETRAGTYAPPGRAPSGLHLDKAFLTLDAVYNDQSGRSTYELARAHVEFEFRSDGAEFDEAFLLINRPLSRFSLPGLKDRMTDALLLGLEDPFWRNEHRVSESYSPLGEALYRDERLQALYTLTFAERFYAMIGVSDGSLLALDGSLDKSLNHPLLQDDRGAFFAGRGVAGIGTKRMEIMAGGGMVFGLRGGGGETSTGKEAALPVIHKKIPFRPNDVSRNSDIVHWNFWWTEDRLGPDEKALIAAALGGSSRGVLKRRLGTSIDLILSFDRDALYLRSEAAHASDGGLDRTFWTIEGSYAFDMGGAMPVLLTVQPFLRVGGVSSNARGPALSATSSPTDVTGAMIAADRLQTTGGLSMNLHRSVRLVVEYARNVEDFETPTGVAADARNDLFLASLRVDW